MPESTLSLTIDDLKGEIGAYLGYGRGVPFGEPAWDNRQTNNITAVLKSALSLVYTPPPLTEGGASHNWSFLRPFANLTLPSGESTAQLPESFGGFEGPIYVTSPSTAFRQWPLKVSHEGMVQQQHAAFPDTVGAPRIACEKQLPGTTREASTRSVLYVWPTADASYLLSIQFKHLPGALTGGYPYPPGGAEHAELFKAACLAKAEIQIDDERGVRWQEFMTQLAASIQADRKRKGDYLGYNADRSDMRRNPRVPGQYNRFFDNPGVTYNGSPL